MENKTMKTFTIDDVTYEIVDEKARDDIKKLKRIDDTLTQYGQSADAGATGDAISQLSNDIANEANVRTNAIADIKAKIVQQTPLFANSIEECTDTNNVYILPDGYIYGYMRKPIYLYTNQIPISVDIDGSQFVGKNGEFGYDRDTLVTVSTGEAKPYSGTMSTGFIPVKNGDVLYFKDYLLKPGVADAKCQFVLYKSDFSHLVGSVPDAMDAYGYLFKYTSYDSGYLKTLTINDKYNNGIAYLRFSAPDISKAVITINEEIVDTDEPIYDYMWENTGHKFIPADCEERIIPLEESVESHESRIRTLEMYGSNSTSAEDIPAYIKTEADDVMNRLIKKQGNRSFTMVAMSDFHYGGTGNNKDNLIRACKAVSYMANRMHIDAIATLGDNLPYGEAYDDSLRATADRWYKEINEILATTQKTGIVDLRTCGNHDRFGTPEIFMPDNAIYSFIGGYNRQCDYVNAPIGYAYKDFDSYNLRIIVLNTAESEGKGRFEVHAGYHMSTKQYKWLIDTLDLSSKPNASDWQIVLLSHHRADDYQVFISNTERYFLPSILHAYNTGGSFSGVNPEDGATISCNFAGKNSAKLIGQIHGHHHSYIYGNLSLGRTYNELTGETNVMAVSTPTSSLGSGSSHNDDNDGNNYPNVKDTAEETAFCVYSIDLDNHKIHAIHYGAGIDREISY